MAGWIKDYIEHSTRTIWLKCPHCDYYQSITPELLRDIPYYPHFGEKPTYPCLECKRDNHLPSLHDRPSFQEEIKMAFYQMDEAIRRRTLTENL